MGAKALMVRALTTVLLSGCGHGTGFGNVTTYYAGYAPDTEERGVRAGGPLYLVEVDSEGPDQPSTEAEVAYAIDLMIHDDCYPGGEVSYWVGPCAPAEGVGKVEISGHVVGVELKGAVPDLMHCRLSLSEKEAQRQQLAWTVRANVDPFNEEDLLVRVIGGDGDVWPGVTPDLDYIEPERRPTSRPDP